MPFHERNQVHAHFWELVPPRELIFSYIYNYYNNLFNLIHLDSASGLRLVFSNTYNLKGCFVHGRESAYDMSFLHPFSVSVYPYPADTG